MGQELSFQLSADFSELARMSGLVRAFGEDARLSEKAVFVLNFTIEELVTNLIKYGAVAGAAHVIRVSLRLLPAAVAVEIEDNGKPFNPLDAPSPDVGCPVEQRKAGGLGIFLLRGFADAIDYERRGDKNLVTVVTKI